MLEQPSAETEQEPLFSRLRYRSLTGKGIVWLLFPHVSDEASRLKGMTTKQRNQYLLFSKSQATCLRKKDTPRPDNAGQSPGLIN